MAANPSRPSRGEIWTVDLNPVRGHEQASVRPALVISADLFNHGPAELVIIVPLTRTARRIPYHVPIDPPEGGVTSRSFAKCEDIRSVSIDRLSKYWGTVTERVLEEVEDRLHILLQFDGL